MAASESAPKTYEDSLRLLREKQVISERLYRKLKGLGGFRNVLVHEYRAVSIEELARNLGQALTVLPAYSSEILPPVPAAMPAGSAPAQATPTPQPRQAQSYMPWAIAAGREGNADRVYVLDGGNKQVFKLLPVGWPWAGGQSKLVVNRRFQE
ncbi:MAG: DUF86 domain-containing protein [Chloroflexi bacterium]|nr:DUF86 domain-containing protein [Chloroflexota bacterium]